MADHRMTWQNPRILCILLLVFLCGATAGALAMRFGSSSSPRRVSSYWQEGGKEISIERFRRELNLTPEQAQQMETILNDFMMYYQQVKDQLDNVRADGKAKILQILSDEQKQKFVRMLQETKQNR
ncbi:MAG: hypothetical protein NZV14_10450 [Bryobacteraceae bacterium]|nr:hypothetical protein [Bryobacteraceae bacterium]MDW8378573.1 hypothetical protein [Bryobacterales bacterium]